MKYTDPSGNFWFLGWIVAAIVGAIINVVVDVAITVVENVASGEPAFEGVTWQSVGQSAAVGAGFGLAGPALGTAFKAAKTFVAPGIKTLKTMTASGGGLVNTIVSGSAKLGQTVTRPGFLRLGTGGGEAGAGALTGQSHHGISNKIYGALEKHPNLRGMYEPRDYRFVTQAKDLASHRGYQTWHRQLDTDIVKWIEKNQKATTSQFENYLRQRYNQPDLLERFPSGF